MRDPGCGPEAWAVLDEKLWHATSVDGLRGIQRDGVIAPGNRYRGSFVSARGWISLFDFGSSARDEWGQWNNWAQWFGATHDAQLSAWLEIDRNAGESEIVEAEALRVLWRQEVDRRVEIGAGGPWRGTIIPGVEGAYQGSLPTALVMRAVVMGADYSVVVDLGALDGIEEQTLDMLLEI